MTDKPPVLELRGITKKFGPVVANDRVDFDLRPGEVHALLGENGAGKSTLMSVLYGLYSPTSGEILVDGKPVSINSPNDAIDLGIGMVHQHFMFIPVMTIAENIVLGNEPVKSGRRAADGRSSTAAPRASACRSSPTATDSRSIRTPASRTSPSACSSASRSSARSTATPGSSCWTSPPRCSPPRRSRELMEVLRRLKAGRHRDHLHLPQARRGA